MFLPQMSIKTSIRVMFSRVVCISWQLRHSLIDLFFILFLSCYPSYESDLAWETFQIVFLQRNREDHDIIYLFSLHSLWFFIACFTFNKLMFGREQLFFYKALPFAPCIRALKAICSINSLTLSIFSSNLFKYTSVDSSSA